jgi:hypothetical protein
MDLTTHCVAVTDAVKYVQGKMDHVNKLEKELLKNIKLDKDKTEQEEDIE